MNRKTFKLLLLAGLAVTATVAIYLKERARKEQRTPNLWEDPAEKASKSGLPVIAEFGRGI